ncbi:ATP-binding protein [Neosynechococcus sphagnicola]|uniref:ATP-binding protein n=1 Tax=Neosynechococcus sphagnicola TaxID=1501145 RepID=UPI000692060A|nr:ATP-binding protein [Neosynechococcus sphagnicola]
MGNLRIQGDGIKIELVLYEVLAAACRRSLPKGRIDIWPRLPEPTWLELSITDNGTIEPRLIADLMSGRSADLLAPSTLDHPPGLHLMICQALLKQMGGELNFYKIEDGRILTRLMLPVPVD